MSHWLQKIRALHAGGRDCVRVTVMNVRGSAPRETGATMLVTADALDGSIGGGQLEYECTRMAAENLRQPAAAPFVRKFPLGAGLGQCCGGVVEVLFEYLPARGADWFDEAWRCFTARAPALATTTVTADGAVSRALLTPDNTGGVDAAIAAAAARIFSGCPDALCVTAGDARTLLEPLMENDFTVALFGAGHVGSALIGVLAGIDCRVRWIDGRRDIFPQTVPPGITCIESAEPAREVTALTPGSFYLVMTHSHALDYEICERVLARGDFAYCGLIGSRSKRRRFEKRLRGQGMSDDRLRKLTCPIGIAGLDGDKPGEIAVAVAAQLLDVRKSRSARVVADASDVNVTRLH